MDTDIRSRGPESKRELDRCSIRMCNKLTDFLINALTYCADVVLCKSFQCMRIWLYIEA